MRRLPVIMPEIILCVWLVLAVVPTPGPTPIYDAFVAILAGPFLIAQLIRAEYRTPHWCDAAGRLSYPLYASHVAVVMIAQNYIKEPNALLGLVTIAAALALAWCIAWANDRIQDRIRPPIMVMKPAGAE